MAFTSTSFGALHYLGAAKKSGAGSRGGHVIGYTRSSKAVYAGHASGHESYKTFGRKDHADAGLLHNSERVRHQKMVASATNSEHMQGAMAAVAHHRAKSEEHMLLAGESL